MSHADAAADHIHPAVRWSASDDAGTWAQRCAAAIAAALRADLAGQSRAVLLVSGGNTPVPVFRALAQLELDWPRVEIGLVDERWTSPAGNGSNARLVRENLLAGHGAAARFTPLVDTLDEAELAARRASEWLASLGMAPSVAVFGLGDDGHTASLFPRAGGLGHALGTSEGYAAIDASGNEAAGRWPTRITLTASAIASCRQRLLLLHGATARHVFGTVLAGEDVHAAPARVLLQPAEPPLQVFWYP